MAWQKYTPVFKLLSPLHVGYRKVGNLLQTRKYVPAKLIWAALAARLTRDFSNGSDAQEYQRIGGLLKQNFRFSYFYPALLKQNKKKITSHDDVEEYYFWDKEAEFEYRFLSSYASTALDCEFQSTEEGSLHEVEYIAPKTRPWGHEKSAKQVFLKGEIYIDKSRDLPEPLNHWQEAAARLQLGAERNYGWGRLKLLAVSEPQANAIEIEYNQNQRVKAHVLAIVNASTITNGVLKIRGEVEPLVGWERAPVNNQGRHWQLSSPFICYVPGSRVTEKAKFEISEQYGLLRPV